MPAATAKHVFGYDAAKNYLIIELVVSNHNAKASLIIESVFLDYGHWAIAQRSLAGYSIAGTLASRSTQSKDDATGSKDGAILPTGTPAQRLNCPAQIAKAVRLNPAKSKHFSTPLL